MKKWSVFILVVLLWGRATAVFAHAILVSANPAPNDILGQATAAVRIRFSEPVVAEFSRIQVFNQAGQRVDNDDLQTADANSTSLAVTLPPLANGAYLVSWEVLSSVDNHTSSGSYPFAVGTGELTAVPGSTSTAAQAPTFFSAGARWLNLLGLALLLGLFAFHLLVWRPAAGISKQYSVSSIQSPVSSLQSPNLRSPALLLLTLSLIFTLLSQAGRFNLLDIDKLAVWLGTQFGLMWLARLGVTAVLIALFHRRPRPQARWSLLGLALVSLLAAATALTSHSAALPFGKTAATLMDFLHLLAAGIWAGGLLQLALALWRVRRLPAEPRRWLILALVMHFSALAAASVGVLIVSGGYLAWKHVGSWVALVGTAYGLTLLAKMALVLPSFGAAGLNLLFLKPRLETAVANPDDSLAQQTQRHLRRLVRLEAVFALLVLLAAGLLTDLQRGQEAPLLGEGARALSLEQTAGDLTITLALDPAQVGSNRFDVYVVDEDGRPVADASEVALRFTFLGQGIGSAEAETVPVDDGHYRIRGTYLSLVGPWQVEVSVRRPGRFDAFAPYRLEAGLNGAIRSGAETSTRLEQAITFLNRSNGLVVGLFLILLAVGWEILSLRAAAREWQLAPLLLPGVAIFLAGSAQLTAFYRDFTPALFASNPVLPDTAAIARGRQLYAANCAVCHGEAGRGDGPAALQLDTPPADFTAGHTTIHLDGDLFYWIKEGIPGTSMPGFTARLSDEDVWHLVNYVRRLSN